MAIYLIVVPLVGALAAFLLPSDPRRPWIVAIVGVLHLALAAAVIAKGDVGLASEWLRFDALGRLVLLVVSTLFCICALYCIGYLRLRAERPNRIFCTALLFFLAMTSLVALAQHLTILWVAMEATTLATAVLLYFNQNQRSLEATWKYLMIGSVGIALALLGTLFLAYGARLGIGEPTLLFQNLLKSAAHLPAPWVRTAFVFLLVGYGTKMGLAPLHTWKPDAYGEAPGVVGALLAGGMTTCAFLALLRVYRIADAAGQGVFARQLLVVFGLLSIATAAAFMVDQAHTRESRIQEFDLIWNRPSPGKQQRNQQQAVAGFRSLKAVRFPRVMKRFAPAFAGEGVRRGDAVTPCHGGQVHERREIGSAAGTFRLFAPEGAAGWASHRSSMKNRKSSSSFDRRATSSWLPFSSAR